jgi:hypothetical protein
MMKKTEIVFAPGCFDDFEGTQQELDEMIADLRKMVEDGTIMENSSPVEISDDEFIDMMNAKLEPKIRQ